MKITAEISVLIDDPKLLVASYTDNNEPDDPLVERAQVALEQALDEVEIPGCSVSASITRMREIRG